MKSGQPESNLKTGNFRASRSCFGTWRAGKKTKDSDSAYDLIVMMKGGATLKVQAESGVPYRKMTSSRLKSRI